MMKRILMIFLACLLAGSTAYAEAPKLTDSMKELRMTTADWDVGELPAYIRLESLEMNGNEVTIRLSRKAEFLTMREENGEQKEFRDTDEASFTLQDPTAELYVDLLEFPGDALFEQYYTLQNGEVLFAQDPDYRLDNHREDGAPVPRAFYYGEDGQVTMVAETRRNGDDWTTAESLYQDGALYAVEYAKSLPAPKDRAGDRQIRWRVNTYREPVMYYYAENGEEGSMVISFTEYPAETLETEAVAELFRDRYPGVDFSNPDYHFWSIIRNDIGEEFVREETAFITTGEEMIAVWDGEQLIFNPDAADVNGETYPFPEGMDLSGVEKI